MTYLFVFWTPGVCLASLQSYIHACWVEGKVGDSLDGGCVVGAIVGAGRDDAVRGICEGAQLGGHAADGAWLVGGGEGV